ncbi:MAG: SpoIID/LytB domain-containing protein [Planctomycetota bacterium]
MFQVMVSRNLLQGKKLLCTPRSPWAWFAVGWVVGSSPGLACRPELAIPHDTPSTIHGPPHPLRHVRVCIANGIGQLTIRGNSGLLLESDPPSTATSPNPMSEIRLVADGSGGIRLNENLVLTGPIVVRAHTDHSLSVVLGPESEESLSRTYSGFLRIVPRQDGLITVVNHVDVETYVSCVVAEEVWPTFEPEVFLAQAIVARTFVLYQMKRQQNQVFDVSATQGSQVYRGLREDVTARRAENATQRTRGMVCAWSDGGRDQLFCTYYSAACGGKSQSAAIFGVESAVPPLVGGVSCDYCRIAPAEVYRWGPLSLSKSEVCRRLATRQPEFAELGSIVDIRPSEVAEDRLVRLTVSGSLGSSRDILAERFRIFIGGTIMRSTACGIQVSGEEVVFRGGRGFGHGLGLCQWGAQGQALQGRPALDILAFYYPGSKTIRAY